MRTVRRLYVYLVTLISLELVVWGLVNLLQTSLPAALALDPPAGLRSWLEAFSGVRIVVPLPAQGWIWAGQPGRSSVELARSTALAVRQLSEGQMLRQAAPTNPWAIAGFVLGGLFALLLAIIIFMTLYSGLN